MKIFALAIAVVLAACSSPPTKISDAAIAPTPLQSLARGTVERAAAAIDKDADYLELRRAIAMGVWLWRPLASTAVDLIVGPLRPNAGDGAGMLGRLDIALSAHDGRAAGKARVQIRGALMLVRFAVTRNAPLDNQVLRAMSDASYELGSAALQALPGTPRSQAAVDADLDGILRLLRESAATISAGKPAAQTALFAINDRLATLERARQAPDALGAFVVETGALGVATRELAAALGVVVRAPYAPAVLVAGVAADEQPISALTIPKPRGADQPAALIALGKQLFNDRRLSKGAVRSCADCHVAARAFTDGKITPGSLTLDPLKRNVPTLLYAPLGAAQLWDGRVRTTAAQAQNVIHTKAEMGLDDVGMLELLAPLASQFAAVFPDGLTAKNVAAALAAYEADAFVPAHAPIDRFARGELALSADEQRGLVVFATAGHCARCHAPPAFAGTLPMDFAVTVYAALGVPRNPTSKLLDEDLGRGAISKLAIDQHAFKTPTVRNIAKTAPYFHHGAYPTLDAVIDFYDRGGGKGIGVAIDNQDPDVVPLHLTVEQKRVLTIFLNQTLLDL